MTNVKEACIQSRHILFHPAEIDVTSHKSHISPILMEFNENIVFKEGYINVLIVLLYY